MSLYFLADFRRGSLADQTGQRTYTVTGSPALVKGEKGMAGDFSAVNKLGYSQSCLPLNAFTLVVWVKKCAVFGHILGQNTGYSSGNIMYIADTTSNVICYLGINVFKSFVYPKGNNFCLIITCTGSAVSDLSTTYAYANGILLLASTSVATGTIQASRSVYTTIGSANNSPTNQYYYIATYDHVFTEQERNKAQADFNNSFPIERPSYDYQAFKATDLKNETGLIAAYNMIPNGNVLTDISGNGNTGTISKAVSSKEGLVFNGKSGSVSLTNTTTGTLTGDITVCTRVYLKSWGGGSFGRIIDGVNFAVRTNDTSFAITRDNGIAKISGVVTLGNWYNLIITSTSAGVTNFYLSGVLSGTPNQSATVAAASNLFIGNSASLNRGFDGTIQDLRIYNRILTTTEIQAYHNQFAKCITLLEDFRTEGADGLAKIPRGWRKVSGSFKISEIVVIKNSDVIVNGGFDTASTWIYGGGWGTGTSIHDGKFYVDGTQVATTFCKTPDGTLTAGKRYKVKFDLTINGSVQICIGNYSVTNAIYNSSGTYIIEGSSSAAALYFIFAASTVATLDNISSLEVAPLTTIKQGSKYLECITAGVIAIPSKQAYGTWELDWYKGADGNNIVIGIISDRVKGYVTNNNLGYFFTQLDTEKIGLYKSLIGSTSGLSGTIINYTSYSTWYRVKITRSISGVFTVYIKGGAFGNSSWILISTISGNGANPSTDNTYTTSEYFVISAAAGDRIANIQLTDGIVL